MFALRTAWMGIILLIMGIFDPTVQKEKITDVTAETLHGMGITSVLLDVDNTLASYISHEPIGGAVDWAKQTRDAGFRLVIVSNNYKSRVEPFAAKFGLPFITFACKPLPFGYLKAKKLLGVKAEECVIIGDQVFTDVVGANLCGMKSILLSPVEPETSWTFRARRRLEMKYRNKPENEQGESK